MDFPETKPTDTSYRSRAISNSVPDEKPEPFESDNYFGAVKRSRKTKRKPVDWLAIASEAARTGLKLLLGVCIGSGILYAAVLWLNWLVNLLEGNVSISIKIGLVYLLVAMIGASAGAWNSYNKQKNND